MKIHPHDKLINKLEECLEDLQELASDYEIDDDEYKTAHSSIDSAINDTRQINL